MPARHRQIPVPERQNRPSQERLGSSQRRLFVHRIRAADHESLVTSTRPLRKRTPMARLRSPREETRVARFRRAELLRLRFGGRSRGGRRRRRSRNLFVRLGSGCRSRSGTRGRARRRAALRHAFHTDRPTALLRPGEIRSQTDDRNSQNSDSQTAHAANSPAKTRWDSGPAPESPPIVSIFRGGPARNPPLPELSATTNPSVSRDDGIPRVNLPA